MKCPLLMEKVDITTSPYKAIRQDCLEKECPWWSEEMNQCDPTGLLPWLRNIANRLDDIANKMPH